MVRKILVAGLALILSSNIYGCSLLKKMNKSDQEEITRLKEQLAKKDSKIEELDSKIEDLMNAKDKETSELESAKQKLVEDLKKEIGDYKAKLEMTERGLVITFLAEVFFTPGKAEIKEESYGTLDKVAKVLNEKVPEKLVAVEGHTDADPIKYSGWKSNWELSSARSLSVLHYFVDKASVEPTRLSAVGYGEYKPVESNDTKAGKQKNRRVEIVILPHDITKVKKN